MDETCLPIDQCIHWSGKMKSSVHLAFCGPTGSGKTTLACGMIENRREYFEGDLGGVAIVFKEPQEIYRKFQANLKGQGVKSFLVHGLENFKPENLSTMLLADQVGCLLVDDHGADLQQGGKAAQAFSAQLAILRHRRIQVFLVLHRLYASTGPGRLLAASITCFVFTPSRRQTQDVRSLALQLGLYPRLLEAFHYVCQNSPRLRCLLVDLSGQLADNLRLRCLLGEDEGKAFLGGAIVLI